MATWQKIGGIEVCEGTDGVAGVSFDGDQVAMVKRTMHLGWGSKADFELAHCRPLHEIEECADGSVIVRSVEKIDGKTARAAFITQEAGRYWVEYQGSPLGPMADKDRDEAIGIAVAYVSAR